MVTYQFVKITADLTYFGDLDQMIYDNRLFMGNLTIENDFVIAQGVFDEYNSGVLILDVPTTEEAVEIIKQHPAVKAGQLKYEVMPVWMAKGTFCKR